MHGGRIHHELVFEQARQGGFELGSRCFGNGDAMPADIDLRRHHDQGVGRRQQRQRRTAVAGHAQTVVGENKGPFMSIQIACRGHTASLGMDISRSGR